MKNCNLRSNWLILLLLSGVILRLFWLEAKAPFSQAGHIWAEIGLALLLYTGVALWLKANERALLLEDRENLQAASQANRLSNQIPGTDSGLNSHGEFKPALSKYAGRITPAWLVAFVSSLGEFFHSLH